MRTRGFTYIGIMIFIAILGIASMAAVTSADFFSRRNAEGELLAIGDEFNQAFLSYYNKTPAGTAHFPRTLDDLVRDPRYPGIMRHLRRIYPDPLTGKAEWGLIKAPEGGIAGVYSLASGTPIRQRQSDLYQSTPLQSAPDQSVSAEGGGGYADWQFGYYTATNQNVPLPAQSTPSANASAQ